MHAILSAFPVRLPPRVQLGIVDAYFNAVVKNAKTAKSGETGKRRKN
jgi:hypothetical protein